MPVTTTCPVELYFMPDDRGAAFAAASSLINGATSTYREMIYEFGDEDYAAALVTAYKRGVDVLLLVDHLQSCGKSQQALLRGMIADGFPATRIGITTSVFRQIMHDKMGIADGDTDHGSLMEGSLNWSASALRQDNTLTVLYAPTMAKAAFQTFAAHWQWTKANESRYQLTA